MDEDFDRELDRELSDAAIEAGQWEEIFRPDDGP
jgi:hypothetical protein